MSRINSSRTVYLYAISGDILVYLDVKLNIIVEVKLNIQLKYAKYAALYHRKNINLAA